MKQFGFLKLLAVLAVVSCCVLALVACGKCSHEWSEWQTTGEPVCGAEGVRERTCAKCDETEVEAIAALAHEFVVYVSNGDATCVTVGSETATCVNCGVAHTRETSMDANKHESEGIVVTIDANDSAYHEQKRACCGAVVSREAHNLHRHSLTLAEGVTSCTDGVVKTWRCTVCEYDVTETVYTHIDAEGEDFANVELPVERIMLGAYLTAAGVRYEEEPYIEIVAECLCGAHAGEINLVRGATASGEWLFDTELAPFSSSLIPDAATLRREIVTAFYSDNVAPEDGGVSAEYKILFEERLVPMTDCVAYELRIALGYNEVGDTWEEEHVFLLREIESLA